MSKGVLFYYVFLCVKEGIAMADKGELESAPLS